MNNIFHHVEAVIKKAIPDARVEVTDLTGTSDHLGIKVISDTFIGQTLLAQHRTIMELLKVDLKDKIHAVKIQTLTYAKYQQE